MDNSTIRKYPSIFAAVNKLPEFGLWRMPERFDKFGTLPDIIRRWEKGPKPALLDRIRKTMQQIDESMEGRTLPQWNASLFGAYPIVPDYLAGDLFSMRHKAAIESDIAPITVWVESGLSQSFSEDQAARRATAIAALIAKLGESRPVEAKMICASRMDGVGHRFIQTDVDTHTLDETLIAQVFAMPEIVRPLRWALIWEDSNSSSIGWAFNSVNTPSRLRSIREKFGMRPQDVFIPAAINRDHDTATMLDNPVQWVHEQIAKQRSVSDED